MFCNVVGRMPSPEIIMRQKALNRVTQNRYHKNRLWDALDFIRIEMAGKVTPLPKFIYPVTVQSRNTIRAYFFRGEMAGEMMMQGRTTSFWYMEKYKPKFRWCLFARRTVQDLFLRENSLGERGLFTLNKIGSSTFKVSHVHLRYSPDSDRI